MVRREVSLKEEEKEEAEERDRGWGVGVGRGTAEWDGSRGLAQARLSTEGEGAHTVSIRVEIIASQLSLNCVHCP